MKTKVSGGAAAVIIVIVVAIAAFFGWRFLSGGPSADVTKQNLDFWKKGGPPPNPKVPGAGGRVPGGAGGRPSSMGGQ